MEMLYALFMAISHYVYSGVLTQVFESAYDLRPITYTSGSFSDKQQRWSETEKEAFADYQNVYYTAITNC